MRRCLVLLCLPLALAACGTSTPATKAGFTGAKHEVAETIADLQSNASASEPKKICSEDLAAGVVRRLGGAKGCETAVKRQLGQVDSLEVAIESVRIATGGDSATATVRSIHEGKTHASTLSLVKESGKWKISGS
jgi:hypothetical protein